MAESRNTVNRLITAAWWIALLRGVAFILLGILLLMRPFETTAGLILAFGLYLLIEGSFAMIFSIARHGDLENWGLEFIRGLLGFSIGLIALFKPVLFTKLSALGLLLIISGGLIANGILRFFAVFAYRSWSMLFGALLSIFLGLLLFFEPAFSARFFVTFMGISLLIGGVILVLIAFKLERIAKRFEKRQKA